MDIREFEGRLKKLVYGKDTISIRQLQFAFTRDFEDFDDLNNPDSQLYKIFTSPEFKGEESDEEMSIQYLLLLGLLYCQGTNEEKTKVFYDVLQDGLQEYISANDKDLKDCFGRLVEMGTANIHKWTIMYGDYTITKGINPKLEKNGDTNDQWKEAINNIQEKFLDDVFDVNSKIPRDEFIKSVSYKQNFLFKPAEMKKLIIE